MKKDDRVAPVPVTFKVVTALTPLKDAVMFTLPGATPAASPGLDCPADPIEAIFESEDDQVAEVVTIFIEPSLKPAVTLNCSVFPTVTEAAVGDRDGSDNQFALSAMLGLCGVDAKHHADC